MVRVVGNGFFRVYLQQRIIFSALQSDFNIATKNNEQNKGRTFLFASSNWFANKSRHSMDDLESLVFSIWSIACVPGEKCDMQVPEGLVLFKYKENGMAAAKMLVIF